MDAIFYVSYSENSVWLFNSCGHFELGPNEVNWLPIWSRSLKGFQKTLSDCVQLWWTTDNWLHCLWTAYCENWSNKHHYDVPFMPTQRTSSPKPHLHVLWSSAFPQPLVAYAPLFFLPGLCILSVPHKCILKFEVTYNIPHHVCCSSIDCIDLLKKDFHLLIRYTSKWDNANKVGLMDTIMNINLVTYDRIGLEILSELDCPLPRWPGTVVSRLTTRSQFEVLLTHALIYWIFDLFVNSDSFYLSGLRNSFTAGH